MAGLPEAQTQRYHFDIYAILEGAQEMYFGHEVQVNINLVETVKLVLPTGERMVKCYLSPTKRRGVERRSLLWAPMSNGQMLGEAKTCAIPKTCAQPSCPICGVYGGLEAGKKTLIGRLTHGGGVAVQTLQPEEKQRAMHPSDIENDPKANSPTPFRRQYNEPGLLYPVFNHCLSVEQNEFNAVAYAFLDSLARIGAGNPKGARIAEDNDGNPLLVVDRYLTPKGSRPVISPLVNSAGEAVKYFSETARKVHESCKPNGAHDRFEGDNFTRWIGDAALTELQDWANSFVNEVLKTNRTKE